MQVNSLKLIMGKFKLYANTNYMQIQIQMQIQRQSKQHTRGKRARILQANTTKPIMGRVPKT